MRLQEEAIPNVERSKNACAYCPFIDRDRLAARSRTTALRGELPPQVGTERFAVTQSLGIVLQRERLVRDLSQEFVAQNAGLAVITYGSLERGQSRSGGPANPTLETLLRVFEVLEIKANVESTTADAG